MWKCVLAAPAAADVLRMLVVPIPHALDAGGHESRALERVQLCARVDRNQHFAAAGTRRLGPPMGSNDDGSGSISAAAPADRRSSTATAQLNHLLLIMGRCSDEFPAELPQSSRPGTDPGELDRSIDRAFHLTHQFLTLGHPTPRERVVVDLHDLVSRPNA